MKTSRGFSLLELMIVIAVIAITLAWAIPSYQDSVRKARRTEAQSLLREFEVCAARQYTVNSSYVNAKANCEPVGDAYYTYAAVISGANLIYEIKATPKDSQTADKCGILSLKQTGKSDAKKIGVSV